MSATASAFAALAAAFVCAYVLTPVAIRVARLTGFLDRPHGYKGHKAPTPYLGGAAVIGSLLIATSLFADVDPKLLAILACTGALAVVGAVDDRVALPPVWRIAAELAATSVLFAAGVHWSVFGNAVPDFALTALWIVGIVNAFNLMDNMDGTTATVTAVSCAGIGALALIDGHAQLALAAFAVTGACAGFLPRNLAGPARIFLGDGGSMPLGFLVAALAMGANGTGGDALLVAAMITGLPILDTALVSISRTRRGLTLVTAGRDHLTHRLLRCVRSPRGVCIVLLAVQGLLAGLGVAVARAGEGPTLVAAGFSVALGLGAIAVLDSPPWRPAIPCPSGLPAANATSNDSVGDRHRPQHETVTALNEDQATHR